MEDNMEQESIFLKQVSSEKVIGKMVKEKGGLTKKKSKIDFLKYNRTNVNMINNKF